MQLSSDSCLIKSSHQRYHDLKMTEDIPDYQKETSLALDLFGFDCICRVEPIVSHSSGSGIGWKETQTATTTSGPCCR